MAGGTAQFDDQINDFLEGIGNQSVKESQEIIDLVLQKYTRIWQKNLHDRGINASDNLSQSIGSDKDGTGWEYEYSKDGKINGIKLYLPDYYEYTDLGRGKSKSSSGGVLRNNLFGPSGWIAKKKLIPSSGMDFKSKRKLKNGTVKVYTTHLSAKQANKALSFLISRKIHNNGFNATYQKRRKGWFSSELKSFEKELVEAFNKVFTNVGEINISINP